MIFVKQNCELCTENLCNRITYPPTVYNISKMSEIQRIFDKYTLNELIKL